MGLNFMGDGTKFIVLGVSIFLFSVFSEDQISEKVKSIDPESIWSLILNGYLKDLPAFQSFFIGMTMLGIALTVVGRNLKKLWDDKVKLFASEKIGELQNQVNDIKNEAKSEISRIGEENRNLVREISAVSTKSRLDQLLIGRSEIESKSMLRDIWKVCYGEHSVLSQSLISAIDNRYKHYFSEVTPHKSGYKKTVTIEESDDDGVFTWAEHCSYRIHCIAMRESYAKPVPYQLGYESSFIFPRRDSPDELNKYRLTISIGEGDSGLRKIFDSKSHLIWDFEREEIVSKDDKLCVVSRSGDDFRISIAKEVLLENEYTTVKICEDTSLQDTTYAIHNKEPVCCQEIYITIPKGWKFTATVCSDKSSQTVEGVNSRRAHFYAQDWVLPGLSAFFSWEKDAISKSNTDSAPSPKQVAENTK